MAAEELERIVEAGMQAWNDQDEDAFIDLFADGFVWRDTTLPEPITTADGAAAYMSGWFTAFPDLVSRTENVVASESAAAAEFSFRGTNTGPLAMGGAEMPATGKSVTSRGMFFLRAENGKVTEFSTHPDVAGMLMQLGVLGGQTSDAATP